MRTLDKSACDNRTVLKHILEIYQIAVMHMLCEIVGIVEMDYALVVCINDFLGKKDSVCDITGNLTRHIVALGGVYNRVFIGIFLLDFFVIAFDKRKDLVVGGVAFTNQRTDVAIGDIVLCNLKSTVRHDLLFHQVLNFFNGGSTV